jgi:uncharacterized protein
MQQQISIKITPQEATINEVITQYIAATTGVLQENVTGFTILKKSLDARSRHQIWCNLTLQVFINEPFINREITKLQFKSITANSKTVLIVGAGPAGLFAALQLLQQGIKPIILERGKDVRSRRRDLAQLNKNGLVNPESNYCFGEGGAGTYSDGKLYTRSTKRGNINDVLNIFVEFGANENILFEAHPHIGTNKLPIIISAMSEAIIANGGSILFEHKVTNFVVDNNNIKALVVNNNISLQANAYILATGHSAKDIFELLHKSNILIEAKPFALGVRVEHPQHIIDSCQYNISTIKNENEIANSRGEFLPPAAYSLVQQIDGKGVFSFCMCPGGIIAPAATNAYELVVNGWSPSKRNNPFANSGMVVEVDAKNAIEAMQKNKNYKQFANPTSPLLFMYFQQMVEQDCHKLGGGNFKAPAQRIVDFSSNKLSSNLPINSYIPGLESQQLSNVLPSFINNRLQKAFKMFGNKLTGYFTNEAVVVATESRTSSPVKIPRDKETLLHLQIKNLYPCGEGAGYAGGIVSAAIDGQNVAKKIAETLDCK